LYCTTVFVLVANVVKIKLLELVLKY
jgi:hypothetical protein